MRWVAAGYLLETPCIRRYSFTVTPGRQTGWTVRSENLSGADNQQERSGLEQWVVGFVDGEGCFSISVVRNRLCRLGWQVQPEFSVTQLASSRSALELLIEEFGCGRVIEQHRPSSHHEPLCRFSVKRRRDLVDRLVPYFEEHPLRTAKKADFVRFAAVLHMMEAGEHLELDGLRRIAQMTEQMNRRQQSRFLKSSEAIRQPPHLRR